MSAWLRFRGLRVDRMPGFEDRGFRLEGLTDGINLVHGPNASGKTTAARALQRLLWSGGDERAALSGRFHLGAEDWRVEVDGHRVRWERDGEPSSPPALPGSGTADRYLLSLADLLRTEDRELADRIRVESAGGYDLAAAADALDFGAGGQPRSLLAALKVAREQHEGAAGRAAALRRERGRLADLESRRRELAERAAEAPLLERARARVVAAESEAAAERELALRPAAAGKLRGDEVQRWEEWADREERLRDVVATATTVEAGAERDRAAAGLGDEGVSLATLTELERRLEAIRAAEAEVRAGTVALNEARGRRERVGAALGIAPAPPVDLALPEIARLDRFLERAQRVRAERAVHESWLERLGEPGTARSEPDDESLDPAIRALQGWLRAASGGPERERWSRLVNASAVGFSLLAAALTTAALAWTPALLFGALAALAAVVLLLSRPPARDPREGYELEARRHGHAPEAWSEDAVRARLDELQQAVARRAVAAERRAERERWERQRASLGDAETELERMRTELRAELGLDPGLDDLSLALFAVRLREWEDARAGEEAATQRLEAGRAERDASLVAARALLAPFGYEPDDAARAAACLEELKERRERHAVAVATLEQTRRDRIRAEEELDALAGQRAALLDGIGAEDEHALRSLAGQRQARLDAENALELARRELARADAALLEAAGRTGERVGEEGAEAIVAELQGATLAEIDARLSAAEAGALEERAVADEIAGIRRSLEDARSRHDVEDALAAVDAAKADLADRRDRDVDDAIGQALVTWLEGTASDTNRPRVFHRARELLSVITRGQFRLEMSRDGDVFRAYDTVAERGRALDELSSGTRIQLLTAVRVAFVETQEHGAAPPLLLDEVLANADDTRARAIIETALGLARAGRQVFYFTAQADELEKWRELLTQAGDIEWGEYGLGDPSDGPAFDWSDRRWADRVPAPDDLSHGAYGALLDVPRFDPWVEGVGGLHLWYLVEDVDALHELLDLGIDRYGKLQGFARHGGGLEAIRGVLDDARSHAELCRRFGEYWRRGRGRPVDRAALEESGAVTATFMDRVAALCQRVEGSAQALLAALDEGGVPRFRTASIEDLRDFFLRAGHLDEAEPLDDDAIRLRLVGLATSHFGPDAANDVVCRLIERLRHGPARVREGAR